MISFIIRLLLLFYYFQTYFIPFSPHTLPKYAYRNLKPPALLT
jgi:hypothetical protein